jgi:hypothetical protein
MHRKRSCACACLRLPLVLASPRVAWELFRRYMVYIAINGFPSGTVVTTACGVLTSGETSVEALTSSARLDNLQLSTVYQVRACV